MRTLSLAPPRRRSAFAARFLCLAVLIAACGDGSPARAPAAGDSSDAPAETRQGQLGAAGCQLPRGGYTDSCNSCLATSCCAPIDDCLHDQACNQQLGCVIDCQNANDPTQCSLDCLGDAPHPSYLSYDDCSFDACRSSCWM
jgi:hypothetical protein